VVPQVTSARLSCSEPMAGQFKRKLASDELGRLVWRGILIA